MLRGASATLAAHGLSCIPPYRHVFVGGVRTSAFALLFGFAALYLLSFLPIKNRNRPYLDGLCVGAPAGSGGGGRPNDGRDAHEGRREHLRRAGKGRTDAPPRRRGGRKVRHLLLVVLLEVSKYHHHVLLCALFSKTGSLRRFGGGPLPSHAFTLYPGRLY